MFVFGSQYLRGMTPPREDWQRDMRAMRAAGFNTIRAWLVWGVLEPRPGQIDFDTIARFLDLAQENNLRVGLLFHLHGAPEWACGSFSQYWYVNSRGRAFEPSQRANTPSGGWPGLCPDHVEVRELEAAFIEPIVERFGEHAAAAFWEPINEPHMWVDLAEKPPGEFCYCPATRRAFREWLRGRYDDLAALERAWGRRFGDWADVRPPTWRFGFADWADWRTFAAESVAAHVARRVEMIRRFTTRPIIAHAWGGGSVTCGQLGAMAFDDWKNALTVDAWGYSAFPSKSEHVVSVGLGTDATRGAAGDKEFWQSELGSADHGAGLERRGRCRPEIQAMFCWESIRHGAKGLLFWQYRKEAHGSEFGCLGLTDYAGGPTPLLEAVARVGRALNENAELFHAVQVQPAEVAILFSYRSFMGEWAQYRNNDLGVDCLGGYYRAFWNADIPVDILHEEFLSAADLQRYRLIVLPMPAALHRAARGPLRQFVQRGGWALSDPYLCAFNHDMSLAAEVPGGGLAEVFGCREDDVLNPPGPVELRMDGRSFSIARSHFQAFWRPEPAAEVVATYADGRPAIVANAFGTGRAIISGVNLGRSTAAGHSLADDVPRDGSGAPLGQAADVIRFLAERAGVRSRLAAPPDVRASLLTAADGRGVLIAINTADGPRSGIVRMEGESFTQADDLLEGRTVGTADGTITLDFAPHGTRVIFLRP